MAPFKLREDYQRLDWKILHNGAVSLYVNGDALEEDCEWFRQNAYHVSLFDASRWKSNYDFFDELADTLHIERCSGLDQFNDCLGDVDVPYESGSVLVFQHFDRFARKDHYFAQQVLDIIETTSRLFSLQGYRFLALVQVEDTQMTFESVGARPIMLNPLEDRRRFRTQMAQASEKLAQRKKKGKKKE